MGSHPRPAPCPRYVFGLEKRIVKKWISSGGGLCLSLPEARLGWLSPRRIAVAMGCGVRIPAQHPNARHAAGLGWAGVDWGQLPLHGPCSRPQ